jgi:Stress responsive A/B Barrel Domain
MKICIIILFASIMSGNILAQKPKQKSKSVLRHVVIFKYKDTSTPAEIEKVSVAFAGLKTKIKEVKAFEWGINSSPEHFDQGFTHCYVLTFSSEKDRDEVYQKHEAHKAFQEVLKPHMDKVFVVDYWTK